VYLRVGPFRQLLNHMIDLYEFSLKISTTTLPLYDKSIRGKAFLNQIGDCQLLKTIAAWR